MSVKFSILSLFPSLMQGYFGDSILKNALDSGLIEVEFVDFRDFSQSRHKKVDSPQIGGGAGMVIDYEVLEAAINAIASRDSHIIYATPVAKRFNNADSARLARNYKHIIIICGRYEGVDERIIENFVDEVFCIGDFILTGGELAALAICDSVSRQIPAVLGNENSLDGESFENALLEAPIFANSTNKNFSKKNENLSYPSEYSKGNHSKIANLKYELSLRKTQFFRPDIYKIHI